MESSKRSVALSAAAACALAGSFCSLAPTPSFVVSPPPVGALPQAASSHISGQSASPATAGLSGHASSGTSTAPIAAMLAVAAFVGLAHRRSERESSRMPMQVRGRAGTWFRMGAKGAKPLHERLIAKDIIEGTKAGWLKKYRKASDMEETVKKTLYGNLQMRFTTNHFTDEIPWPEDRSGGGGMEGPREMPDKPWYRRKFMNPARFKKLDIKEWEMPENYSRSVSLEKLVGVGMQYGHSRQCWATKMMKYVYAEDGDSFIFDLVQTSAQLNRACYYAQEAAIRGAKFLFVGCKMQAQELINEYADKVNMPRVSEKWTGGLITNSGQIAIARELWQRLRTQKDQGAWDSMGGERRELQECMLRRLDRKYAGIEGMEDFPDIIIMVDQKSEAVACHEAGKMGIPIICLCDTNADPDKVDITVPGNCGQKRSIELFLQQITEAIKTGQDIRASRPRSDDPAEQKSWDPWMFSSDRIPGLHRSGKFQPWMRDMYGTYENVKRANPYGKIRPCAPFVSPVPWVNNDGQNQIWGVSTNAKVAAKEEGKRLAEEAARAGGGGGGGEDEEAKE